MAFTAENTLMRLAVYFANFVLLIARGSAFAHTPCVPPDRGDLGVAYMRFDALARAMPKDPAMREQLNRGFDALTADFFAMRFSNALSSLARIQADVRQLDDDSRAEFQFVASHRFEFTPRTVSIGAGGLDPTSPISPISAIVRVTDLDLKLYAPANPDGTPSALVDQDVAEDNYPVIGLARERPLCPTIAGVYRLEVTMYSGAGEFGVQVFGGAQTP